MVEHVISALNPYIKATGLVRTVLGLCELVESENSSFPVYYIGNDNAISVLNHDIDAGVAFWLRNGELTQEYLPEIRENDPVIRVVMPLRLIVIAGRTVLGRDVSFSPEILSQNIRPAVLKSTLPAVKNAIGASRAYTQLSSIDTDTNAVFSQTFPGIDIKRLDNMAIAININAYIVAREACLMKYTCRQSVLAPVPGGAILFNNETAVGEVALINPGGDFLIPNQY